MPLSWRGELTRTDVLNGIQTIRACERNTPPVRKMLYQVAYLLPTNNHLSLSFPSCTVSRVCLFLNCCFSFMRFCLYPCCHLQFKSLVSSFACSGSVYYISFTVLGRQCGWELRVRGTNHRPSFHLQTPLSAHGHGRESVITWW